MSNLQVFNSSEFGELGVLIIEGREYFPATACARILGHKNPQRAIREFCKGVTEIVTPSKGGQQKQKFIPEGDLYRLIIRSKLPGAERFERWVFDEVLPAIRKHGAYVPSGQIQDIIQQTATAVVAEVIRQLVPVITKATQPDSPMSKSFSAPAKEFPRKRPPSIIGKLDLDLRRAVEDMICSGQYTYLDIVEHLSGYGIELSVMAVQRYAKRMASAGEFA